MARRNETTPGPWHYRPSQTRHIVSETGESVCRVHRGKKAQHNGPVLAASWEMLEALEETVYMRGIPDDNEARSPYEQRLMAVIAKAKGETQ